MYGETEKMRFDAQRYIIDRNLGATTKEGDLKRAVGAGVEALRKALSAEVGYRFPARGERSAVAVAVVDALPRNAALKVRPADVAALYRT